MGGCRCTFRKCQNSTLTAPGFHFFHFPIRDLPRCEKWALFSNNKAFLTLPYSVLRNKVVCQAHFHDNCFMNYKKESLIKTAVPTLHVYKDGETLDLESSEGREFMEMDSNTDNNKEQNNIVSPVTEVLINLGNTRKRPITETTSGQLQLNKIAKPFISVNPQSPVAHKLLTTTKDESKRIKMIQSTPVILNKITTGPKILNAVNLPNTKNSPMIVESLPSYETFDVITKQYPETYNEDVENEQTIPTDHIDAVSFNTSFSPTKMISSVPVASSIDKKDIKECVQSVIESFDVLSNTTFNDKMMDSKKEFSAMKENINKILMQQNEIIEHISKQQSSTSVDSTTTAKNKNSGEAKTKSNQNKMQLFGGIKKYLSPAMVTLLRVELFGTADRDWKNDEKSLMADVLRLGPNVYEFMRDEWRLRFPQLKEVENWMNDASLDEDDDDC